MENHGKKWSITSAAYGVMLIWLVLVAASYYFSWAKDNELVQQMAITEARGSYNKDLVYRRWTAAQGGVYVPINAQYPPNPYLSEIPNRDIVTQQGAKLTLINPAYMTRQVHEFGKEQYGERGHITSLTPIRPGNVPDPWEGRALESFETGVKEVTSLEIIDGMPYMRLMKPMVTEEICLKCHAKQGYQSGDIRGGISVSVPYLPYLELLQKNTTTLASAHVLLAVFGLFGIGLSGRALSRKQNALNVSEKRHRLALLATQGGVWEWDITAQTTHYSPKWTEILGYSYDDPELPHTFESWESRIHPDDHAGVMAALKDHLEKNKKYVVEYRHLHSSGEYRWQKVVGEAEKDNTGKPIKMFGYIEDITEQRQAEEDNVLMSFAMAQIKEMVFLVDDTSHFRYVNDASCLMLGYSRNELLQMKVTEIDPGFSGDKWTGHWQELQDYGTLNFETTLTRKDKTAFPASLTTSFLEFGDTNYSFALALDITQQKKIEEEQLKFEKQLLQTQKFESLGVLAGGVAHDFNNLLAVVLGHSELAKRRLPPSSAAVDNLKQIEQAADRAADLARQMLAYSGRGKFEIETIDLNLLLEEMLHMLEVSISKKAVLRINPFTPLPTIAADATQIRQIVMNLVINASEAIGEKSGVISITTGCMDCDDDYLKNVWLAENLSKGLYVYLEIADTGCGMNAETLTKLFDPFFTTKFTGRGLGMSAVMGIVRGHKGAIRVYSEPGIGTTFKILLPASGRPAEIFNEDTEADGWQGTGRVLLVDDEESVRGIGVEMLQELGFDSATANNGQEAIDILKKDSAFCLVILDLTMPKMDGEQCFREIRKIDPEMKVLISSGYNEFEVSQKFIGKGISGFIQKPYRLSCLKKAIRKLLAY